MANGSPEAVISTAPQKQVPLCDVWSDADMIGFPLFFYLVERKIQAFPETASTY